MPVHVDPVVNDPEVNSSDALIARRLRALRRAVARAAREQRRRWRYHTHRGRVDFDREVRLLHARLSQRLPAYMRGANPWSVVTAPVVYSLLLPFALLDLWVTAYQAICFPFYGIAGVRRRPFFAIDRHKLHYLNAIEKANCTFCAYAHGTLAYVREVAARTEQYWCPIKHARAVPAPHDRYHRFFDYGDGPAYHAGLDAQRRRLKPSPGRAVRPRARTGSRSR